MLNNTDKIIRHKVGLLNLARELGNVSKALHGNPYDGHTLSESIDAAIKNTGVMPEYGFVDRGYRGHSEKRLQIFMSGQRRGVTKSIKRWLKRRSAIEPVIGHM